MKKMVEYSYPTSTNAKRFGFDKTGCYCVELYDSIKPPKALKGFATEGEAVEYAATLPNEWHPLYKHLDETLDGLIEHYCRWKSLDFWRISDHYFIEFESEVTGYKLRQLTKEQADELNKEIAEMDNPLTAANYIIEQILKSRYDIS